MKILNVAYPFAPVREETAGGAEQVVRMLDRALMHAGHKSFVIACEGSQVVGELVETYHANGRLDSTAQKRMWQTHRSAIASAIERWNPDVIHLHGLDFPEYLPPPGIPVLVTLHLPPAWYDARAFAITRPRTWLHCVSQSQQDSCPETPNLLPCIPNGVPEDLPRPDVRKRNFVLALGRICPEKGFHFAFEAASLAGTPLVLAGQVYGYPEHEYYFKQQIVPRRDRLRRFIGAAGLTRKRRLLTAARCLLVPSLAPETSSLVAMEAAVCGTPVIAFRSGALPEIIEEGVTGFLVNDPPEMAAAIKKCDQIDGRTCRETALARFSERRAIRDYFRMYQEAIAR
jgi:glycosyltransferase involved in cell wall biosynthesis